VTSEEEAIVACALDYYEGWFDADPAGWSAPSILSSSSGRS
jgi:hypothetical protein